MNLKGTDLQLINIMDECHDIIEKINDSKFCKFNASIKVSSKSPSIELSFTKTDLFKERKDHPDAIIDLLGCYWPEEEKIYLFIPGIIEAFENIKKTNCDFKLVDLVKIVLYHEIAHFVIHKGKIKGKAWNAYEMLEHYHSGSHAIALQETLAQLITFEFLKLSGKSDITTPLLFELSNIQIVEYRVFKHFIGIDNLIPIMTEMRKKSTFSSLNLTSRIKKEVNGECEEIIACPCFLEGMQNVEEELTFLKVSKDVFKERMDSVDVLLELNKFGL